MSYALAGNRLENSILFRNFVEIRGKKPFGGIKQKSMVHVSVPDFFCYYVPPFFYLYAEFKDVKCEINRRHQAQYQPVSRNGIRMNTLWA